jgi:hypothetical protein
MISPTGLTAMRRLQPGTRFAAAAEGGCIALGAPDGRGGFVGLDSEGVECLFHVNMASQIDGVDVPHFYNDVTATTPGASPAPARPR